ncbi:MAG: NDP-sugar synthase [Pyrinomonadaceae bacterium]
MQALILAGGKGTRLRPLTVFTPKPITPICNRPFLLYQIETLGRAGITDITLCLSYQPDKIEQLLGDGASLGVHLKYTVEPQPMGTAGAYKFAADLIREPTVIFNGDILTDLDLHAVIQQHTERKATATIVLTPVEDPTAYGLVETAPDGRVLKFVEKPKADAITCNTINAGTYILEPQVLDLIPTGEPYMFETGVFPGLLEKGEAFYAHIPDDTYWLDIGTPARYLQAHHDLLADKVTRLALAERRGKCDIATSAEIDKHSMIGDDCVIKPGAQIINSVLGAGCYVEEKAEIRDSVIWPHSRIGSGAIVSGAIIGRGAHIGRSVLVNGGAVLGDKTSLTDYTIIGATN